MFSQAKYLVWFCRLDAFSENSHKIKSYLCFWTSKWRQVKVSSQTFRDCSSASRYLPEIQERSLVWRDFTFISLCFSLPLFLCFPSFFTLQAPKIILSPCAFFYQWFFPATSFYIVWGRSYALSKWLHSKGGPFLTKVRSSQLSVLWKDVENLLYLHYLICKCLPQAVLFTWLFPFPTISLLLPFLVLVSKSFYNLVSAYNYSLARARMALGHFIES